MQLNFFVLGALQKMSSLEPSQQIAISNFTLTILVLFAVFIPILMISRGGKVEENKMALKFLINPFSAKEPLDQIILGLDAEDRAKMSSYEERIYEEEMFGCLL